MLKYKQITPAMSLTLRYHFSVTSTLMSSRSYSTFKIFHVGYTVKKKSRYDILD